MFNVKVKFQKCRDKGSGIQFKILPFLPVITQEEVKVQKT